MTNLDLKQENKLPLNSANSEITTTLNTETDNKAYINTYCIDYALSLQEDMYLSSLECQQENFDDKL